MAIPTIRGWFTSTSSAPRATTDDRRFRTPEILEIRRGPRWHATIETELPGVPLHTVAPEFGEAGWSRARDCIVDVLAELSTVSASPELKDLGVLNESTPFRQPGLTWQDALEALVLRRVDRFKDQLRPVIDDFDTKLARLLKLLRSTKQPDAQLVHGDVTAGNIMVDEQLRPVTVLDFGLLTMAGDPAYDAASAGTMFSLWSPDLRAIEADFDAVLTDRFGYPPELLLMYRAIHLLLISNAHDDDPYDRDAAVPLAAEFFNSNEVIR
ncbi:phosphotransferase [Kribbella sp. NPDC056861]|uniref:phosphotransferase family protein n=1 Tax=Kribbella sp. NPDC056861 TaxID=3154857 RepID=UPI0034128D8D